MSEKPLKTHNRNLRIGRLDNLGGVLKEAGKVYREARRGEIDTMDAKRLTDILATMRAVIETAVIETKLREFEDRAGIDRQ